MEPTVASIVQRGLAEDIALRYYPDPILRRKATPIQEITPELKDLARKMLAVMYREDGVGLAAPQVGISIRMMVINTTGEPTGEKAVLNPRIIEKEGRVDSEEGCLSFPGIRITVKRDEKVTLEYMDMDGQTRRLDSEGLLSRAIQHEMDHLDGILFIDRLTPAARSAVKGPLKDLERRFSQK